MPPRASPWSISGTGPDATTHHTHPAERRGYMASSRWNKCALQPTNTAHIYVYSFHFAHSLFCPKTDANYCIVAPCHNVDWMFNGPTPVIPVGHPASTLSMTTQASQPRLSTTHQLGVCMCHAAPSRTSPCSDSGISFAARPSGRVPRWKCCSTARAPRVFSVWSTSATCAQPCCWPGGAKAISASTVQQPSPHQGPQALATFWYCVNILLLLQTDDGTGEPRHSCPPKNNGAACWPSTRSNQCIIHFGG